MNQLPGANFVVNAQQGKALIQQEAQGNGDPEAIVLNIRVQYVRCGTEQMFQLNIDSSNPFSILVQAIKQNAFAQQVLYIYEEQIKYSYNDMILEESDMRSLKQIGLNNGSTINVRFENIPKNRVEHAMSLEFKFDDKPSTLKLSFKLQQQEKPFEIAIEDTKTAEELFQRIKQIISPMNQPIIQSYKINDLRDEHIYNKSLRDLGYKDGMLINLNIKNI